MQQRAFAIVDSTLREGEQFFSARFNLRQKVEIAKRLDAFGAEYLEVTSPVASRGALRECQHLAGLGLGAKVLTHTRCNLEDARVAVETGVAGVNLVIGASPLLMAHSHGKDFSAIVEVALEVVTYLRRFQVEVRFSAEDGLRTEIPLLLALYQAVDALEPHRIGVADTVGIGTPSQIFDLITRLRQVVQADIEFHGHNDTGCAVANSFAAYEAGATHLDTCILGIGERNGITPLASLMARMHSLYPQTTSKYDLKALKDLDAYVAGILGLEIPFNQPLTGVAAFRHKAGIHAKAVLAKPETYEALCPEDFGLMRTLHIGHRLMGWHALKEHAVRQSLSLSDSDLKAITRRIKNLADTRDLNSADLDQMLQEAHLRAQTSRSQVVQREVVYERNAY